MSDPLPRDARRWVAEALGTFALVAIGPGASMVAARTGAFGHDGVALAFGLAVAVVIAATGHLGGAHVNPAVTLALWTVRRFPGGEVVPYVVAQCTGAVLASLATRWLLGTEHGVGATVPLLPPGRAFAVEAACSALLAFVIMAVATDERASPATAPFAIGATVWLGALVAGPLTGGSFNPARTLGPAVAGGVWTAHWLYWAAPVVGMVAAVHAYERLRGASAPSVPRRTPLGVAGPLA